MSAKVPSRFLTQFPFLRDEGGRVEERPWSKRYLQYWLLARVWDNHPTDDEVKQGYWINRKSFPVRWLTIPKELYGGCHGKRKMEKQC